MNLRFTDLIYRHRAADCK